MSERYSAQYNIPLIKNGGQEKLNNAKVLVIGAGGLGSTSLYCLAGVGIGTIGIVDFDTVSESNLNRQFLHNTERIGMSKADSALLTLEALNPEITYVTYKYALTDENALDIIKDYDIVLAAVDNLNTRKIINRACLKAEIPLINGGINAFSGMLIGVVPNESACLECIYSDISDEVIKKPTSISSVVSTISAMMAQMAINYILTGEMPLKGKILYYDALNMEFNEIKINQSPNCKACGNTKRG